MSGDVVDFAPVPQTRKWARPNWQAASLAVPLAVLGAALGAASLFGEWAAVSLPNGGEVPGIMLTASGPLGTAYVLALIALVAVAAVVLFGDLSSTRNPRVVGIALSGSLLVVLGAAGSLLTSSSTGPAFFGSIAVQQTFGQTLSWGIYAAFGAVIALGGALLLPPPAQRYEEAFADDEEEAEYEDDAIDLTVTVEPVRGAGR